eukprot:GHVN01054095.1.p1 GENE.GHVN01054095.1~~GHVN01054095.1.p1  ORF type:complete len:541 (-),score=83.61 GHVN01054095.1:227-1849(-)
MSVLALNPRADLLKGVAAVSANRNAATGLQAILKTNLGPRGTLKMLVGGAGQVKITKDGNVLLHEMQIQHPTASMIARAATAQDDVTGDGTTTNVLIIGELMKQASWNISEGVHPRLLIEGIELARAEALKILERVKIPLVKEVKEGSVVMDRELLLSVARTALRTKLHHKIADQLTEAVTDAVMCVRKEDDTCDLHMIEVLHMKERFANDTRLIRGMLLDHGARHSDMPKRLKNCYIFTCNVSLEYEKSEVNSGFFYSSAEQREKLVDAERRFTDDKVKKIIDLKKQVCTPENGMTFVVINQKGIDPPALDMFAKENIIAIRRAKRRNMERLTLCCGGNAMNSVEDLTSDDLGFAEEVYEKTLGDEKFTFIEGVRNPHSCAILIKGQNDHTIAQIKDAIRDGLRAVKNTIDDKALIAGAGAFELACHAQLLEFKRSVTGKSKLGVQAFADAMLIVPKCLAQNSAFDVQATIITLLEAYEKDPTKPVGLDIITGQPINPATEGIWDNYRVKRQMLQIAPALAHQLLLVDEVIKAGKQMNK